MEYTREQNSNDIENFCHSFAVGGFDIVYDNASVMSCRRMIPEKKTGYYIRPMKKFKATNKKIIKLPIKPVPIKNNEVLVARFPLTNKNIQKYR